MAVNIATLVQDPEFQSLPASDKRELLTEGDPEFSSLTDQEIEQFSLPNTATVAPVATISPEQQSINQFIKSRQAGPLSKIGTGIGGLLNAVFVEPIKAARGAAEGIAGEMGTASTAPIDLQTALLGSINPLAIPMNRNIVQTGLEAGGRALFDVGNTINQLISQAASKSASNPVGMAAETALGDAFPSINVIRELLPSNPNQEEINKFLQGQQRATQVKAVKSQPLVPEVLGTTNIPLANNLETLAAAAPGITPAIRVAGKGLTGIAKAVVSPIQTFAPRIAAQRLPATIEQSARAALDFEAPAIERHIPVVQQRVGEVAGKVPQTAEEAIKLLNDTEDALRSERATVNAAAEQQGLVYRGDETLQKVSDFLDSIPTATETEKKSIINDFTERFGGDHKVSKGQDFQERLNYELSPQYQTESTPRANLEREAKTIARNNVADQMKDINSVITGSAETPYADIGSVIEVRDALFNKLESLKGRQARSKTGIDKSPGRIPVSRREAVTKAEKTILSKFQKSQIEKLDENVRNIFKRPIEKPPVLQLSPEEIGILRSQNLGLRVPIGEGLQNVGSLEQQIQNLIRTYPQSLRSDPALARLAAESQLSGAPSVPR